MNEKQLKHYMEISQHIKNEMSRFIAELNSAGISSDSLATCRYENVRLFARIEALIQETKL